LKSRRPNVLIYMQMLRLLLDGPRGPSNLAQGLGLNFAKFMEFAGYLESRQLIRKEVESDHEVFYITPAGAQVHRDWRAVEEKLGDVS
jgi:predicted transcriptional regulator